MIEIVLVFQRTKILSWAENKTKTNLSFIDTVLVIYEYSQKKGSEDKLFQQHHERANQLKI